MPLGLPHSEFLAWSDEDRDKALMYQKEMASVCIGCGTRPADWEQNPNAFIGDFYVCQGCARLEEERDNVGEGAKGVHYRLLPESVALARAKDLG